MKTKDNSSYGQTYENTDKTMNSNRSPKKRNYNLYTNNNKILSSGNNVNMRSTFITFLEQNKIGKNNNRFLQNNSQKLDEKYAINIITSTNTKNNVESQNKVIRELIKLNKLEKNKQVKKSSKDYIKMTSFENKMNSDLGKISNNYGSINARSKFNGEFLVKYINDIPNYEIYQGLKVINNKENYRSKVKPIIINKKGTFDKLGQKFFNHLKSPSNDYFDINKEWNDYVSIKEMNEKSIDNKEKNLIDIDFCKREDSYDTDYQKEEIGL
jgi:hypothetical protein